MILIVSIVVVVAVGATAAALFFVFKTASAPNEPVIVQRQIEIPVTPDPVPQTQTQTTTPRPSNPQPQPSTPPQPTPTVGGTGAFGLLNGDMSQGGASPDGWTQVWVGSGKIEAARDTSNFRSAPASLRISSGGGAGEGQVAQLLQLPRRQPFVAGGWLMSAGTARVTFGVQFYDASNRAIQFSEILFTDRPVRWTNASLRIDPPAQATSFALVLYIAGTGQAWLDDVTLTEAR